MEAEDSLLQLLAEAAAARVRVNAAREAAEELESRLQSEAERARLAEETARAASGHAETQTRKLVEAQDSIRRLTTETIAMSRRLESSEAESSDFRRRLAAERERAQAAENTLLEARRHLDRYAGFHRALERSLGWRILQAARSLWGAKW
jgi:chromosome segregation ATPase